MQVSVSKQYDINFSVDKTTWHHITDNMVKNLINAFDQQNGNVSCQTCHSTYRMAVFCKPLKKDPYLRVFLIKKYVYVWIVF